MKRIILMTLLMAGVGAAQAQVSSCTSDLLRIASERYEIGRVQETVSVLRPCVPTGFGARPDRVQAYRLLALSSIALDSMDTARLFVRDLLRVDSRFRADPLADPPMFANLVSDVRPAWYTWPWTGRRWYHWAGRAALVGAAVGVPLLLIDKPVPDLPGPPVFPGTGN